MFYARVLCSLNFPFLWEDTLIIWDLFYRAYKDVEITGVVSSSRRAEISSRPVAFVTPKFAKTVSTSATDRVRVIPFGLVIT